MVSYACVGTVLLTLGITFSSFALFKTDSQLAKVWLAGPTTIAVGA
jgi:uncharacterized membrane protein